MRDENDRITFRFRRSDNGRMETLTLTAEEFLRRFLQHVLPRGFQGVRYFGWMAPAAKARWEGVLALNLFSPEAGHQITGENERVV